MNRNETTQQATRSVLQSGGGFTLVEILIVVVILAILAAIVIPEFSTASAKARASMTADDIRMMRTQVAVFKGQHNGIAPGYPGLVATATPTEAAFVAHMTLSSMPNGRTAFEGTAGYPYGPYFREMPTNPINNKNTVEMIANNAPFPTAGDDSHGWIYQPSTLTFKADSPAATTPVVSILIIDALS